MRSHLDDRLLEQIDVLPTRDSVAYDAAGNPLLTSEQRRAVVEGIKRAAALRRGELADDSKPLDPTAAAIVQAGRRRRREAV